MMKNLVDDRFLRHRKLNDSCKFPRHLDMEPYTKEGLERQEAEAAGGVFHPIHPPEYYQYNLVGIVVHQGTADCGHYYSFIQERGKPN